jgi:FkbM family methyltransferase
MDRVKAVARRLRDHRVVLGALEVPLRTLKRLGFPVPRSVYQHVPHRGVFTALVPGGASITMFAHGEVLENTIYWEGVEAYEPECMPAWLALARTSRVTLDIGANTGLYALVAAASNRDGTVHAFEPIVRIADRLRANCSANPTLNVVVHQSAVGAATGTATIHDPGGDNCYSASLNPTFLAVSKSAYEVPVVAIDDFVTDAGVAAVDLVKLDVEGFEEFALEGMERTLAVHRPIILMEYLSDTNQHLERLLGRLLDSNYAFYHVQANGLERRPRPCRSPHGMNILLAPLERPLGGLRVRGA